MTIRIQQIAAATLVVLFNSICRFGYCVLSYSHVIIKDRNLPTDFTVLQPNLAIAIEPLSGARPPEVVNSFVLNNFLFFSLIRYFNLILPFYLRYSQCFNAIFINYLLKYASRAQPREKKTTYKQRKQKMGQRTSTPTRCLSPQIVTTNIVNIHPRVVINNKIFL